MEYFLPLSILAMAISIFSFLLFDDQHSNSADSKKNEGDAITPPANQMTDSELSTLSDTKNGSNLSKIGETSQKNYKRRVGYLTPNVSHMKGKTVSFSFYENV